jgi:membrane-associated protein
MSSLHRILDLFLHLDKHLNNAAAQMGNGLYFFLFAIIFCETGLVCLPFLPGDSLLFALGALAAGDMAVKLPIVIPLLCLAANCGDLVNYTIGRKIGPRLFSGKRSWLFNRRHLDEAHLFYERHGAGTIILARFVPIIRTFAPFVAGIGEMNFFRFASFSVGGGMLWVVLLSLAGYFFGQRRVVKDHCELVILAIVAISVLPALVHALAAKKAPRRPEPVAESESADKS